RILADSSQRETGTIKDDLFPAKLRCITRFDQNWLCLIRQVECVVTFPVNGVSDTTADKEPTVRRSDNGGGSGACHIEATVGIRQREQSRVSQRIDVIAAQSQVLHRSPDG